MRTKDVVKSKIIGLAGLAAAAAVCMGTSEAATGEMGTGVPNFGIYGSAVGGGPFAIVWSLEDATFNIPSGCSYLMVTPATLGIDTYKMVVATMTMARITGKRTRFYSHGTRDGGCGVDFIQSE